MKKRVNVAKNGIKPFVIRYVLCLAQKGNGQLHLAHTKLIMEEIAALIVKRCLFEHHQGLLLI
ncbi:MAG: hypothetical protein CDV28_10139 [Candidatus Electronema aureum]|uniref:Uncharacterized protein n=1 Tax=Candidatus Electronema aureum TaxID=2005002 RepID=A0A521G568_9BACT|nr:MAG: hypothetical protein CDV28_10139 [Candidatus Electronema aureum]